jgi:hypothetical protein
MNTKDEGNVATRNETLKLKYTHNSIAKKTGRQREKGKER